MYICMNKLNEILIDEGIRKSDLIRDSGLSTSTISKISNKKIVPSLVTQSKIVNSVNNIIKKRKYCIEDFQFFDNNK